MSIDATLFFNPSVGVCAISLILFTLLEATGAELSLPQPVVIIFSKGLTQVREVKQRIMWPVVRIYQ